MQNRNKYLFKNVGILTISKFSSKILIFLLIPLYTNILTTEEYGIYDLIISTVQLIFPILTLNIVDAVMRYTMEKDIDKKECATIGLKYLTISIFIVLIFLLLNSYFKIFQQISGFEFYILLYFLIYGFNEYLTQFAKGLEKIKDIGIASIIGTFAIVLSNILFLIVFKLGLKGFILANVLGLLIQVLYYCFRIKIWQYICISKNKDLNKEMLIYSIPLIFTVVGWWINSAADKYVVSFFCGLASTGILSIAYKIPAIINTIQGIFIQAWQISAIKEFNSDDSALFYGNYFKFINLIMVIACTAFIILAKPIAHIFFAKEFYQAWTYVPFLLISSVFNTASGFLGPILTAQKKSKAMAKSAIYGTIFNVIFNFVLIYLIGIQGATITTMISSYIIYIVRKKEVGKQIAIDNYFIINITWILLIILASIKIWVSNYIIEILLILIIFIMNLQDIKQLLSIKNFKKILKG